jgi:TRAP-type C4-dicarboxylate transport system substrate-binding protein
MLTVYRDTLFGNMTIIGGDALLLFYPPMQALAMPYTYDSIDHLNRVLESPPAKKLMEDFEAETGVKIMGWHNRGPRQLSTSNRPVKSLKDLKGLKMRVPPAKASVLLWETLGASPTC